uniref:Ribosome biogenesis protein BOP1 homolog n=1 Tax=Rhizophora mucronata TaxID=61149 RepID=A0A2P2KXG3_RHIMU
MSTEDFQRNNKRVLIKIRINCAMKDICSAIIRA